MSFAKIYPLLVNKAEKKGGQRRGGYGDRLADRLQRRGDRPGGWWDGELWGFFRQAPRINPNSDKITGVVCGVRVESIEEPLMRQIRYLDKLVDELARGWPMEKILRD